MAWSITDIRQLKSGFVEIDVDWNGSPHMLQVHKTVAATVPDWSAVDMENPPQWLADWIVAHRTTADEDAAFDAKLAAVWNEEVRDDLRQRLDAQYAIIRRYLLDHPSVTAQQARAFLAPKIVTMRAAVDDITGGLP